MLKIVRFTNVPSRAAGAVLLRSARLCGTPSRVDIRCLSTVSPSRWPAIQPQRLTPPDISSRFISSTSSTALRAVDGEGVGAPRSDASALAKIRQFLSRENIVAPDNYNRWLVVPFSFLVQLSIGSVYAWSFFNDPLTREFGVVASAASDWDLGSVVPIFSFCALTLGICTATLGPWAERVGPRMVALSAAGCWSGGLLLTSLGVHFHLLPLCYLGYGVFGGMGWGLGYISPVSTLLKWFPDRRGLATGLALTAFGGGAMVATPINEALFQLYYEAPMLLGAAADLHLVTEGGVRFAEVGGQLKEVVVATAADVARLPVLVPEGVYVVGTGSSGAAKTFATLSGLYASVMLIGAMGIRVPREGWGPAGWKPPTGDEAANKMITSGSVHHNTALRTPQFYFLWGAVAGNAIAGVTVISCAKTMMSDIFGTAMPAIVTGAFAATFVAALSAGNMLGRFGWANASDFLGRKNTYYLFGIGAPICALIPTLTATVATNPGTLPLGLFYFGTFLIVSFYGGVFAVLPAFLADIFGSKHVGAIHGRALTAWSAAAVGGPALLTYMRTNSHHEAITNLAAQVDPVKFEAAFGEPMEKLGELMATHTVTIPTLLQIAPPGVLDPTPSLYNSSLYTMGGVICLAALCNAAIRPVDRKHFLPETVVTATIVDIAKGTETTGTDATQATRKP